MRKLILGLAIASAFIAATPAFAGPGGCTVYIDGHPYSVPCGGESGHGLIVHR